MLSMTSGPKRTHPIARGAWIIEVILNDPPPPPPNGVPPLKDDGNSRNMTIREQFAKHREHADCAGCHSKLDPLGFAMENFDLTGRWREKYGNGREVDSSGKLMRKHASTAEPSTSRIRSLRRRTATPRLLRATSCATSLQGNSNRGTPLRSRGSWRRPRLGTTE